MWRVIWIAWAIACSGRPAGAPPPRQPAPAHAPGDAASGARDAPPLDRDLPALVERSLAMYRDVATAFAASREDCAAATARLRALASRYRDVAAAVAKVLHDGRDKELGSALDPHSEQFDKVATEVFQSPTMSACGRDPAFGKAFDELVEPP